jgi:tetratricopeptide (TPR) repeat protein
VGEAITLDLSQSATLRVMSGTEVRESLRLMRRDTLLRITPAIAREVAEREGVKAVVEGYIRRTGAAFVLSARMLDSRSGALIEGWRATARDSTEIIAAVDSLSASLRLRAGESMQSIRATSPLLKVSTSSMAALRKHSMALTAFYDGDFARSAALYEEAIRLDSTFADAWVSLSVALSSLGAKPARQIEALIKAYGYRDRLLEAERYGVEANYLARVKGDRQGAIDAFRNYTRVDPKGAYWGGLASLLIQSRRFTDAERTLREGFQYQSTPAMFYHLARSRFEQGRVESAIAALDEGERKFPTNPIFARARVEVAAGTGNYKLADSLAHAAPSGRLSPALLYQAQVDAALGKPLEAIEHLRALRSSQLSAGAVAASFSTLITIARLRLHAMSDTAAAVAEIESSLRRREVNALDSRERPYAQLAHFFVEASRYDRAKETLVEYERRVPPDYRFSAAPLLARTRAMLAAVAGDRSGIEELRRLSDSDVAPHGALSDLLWAYMKTGARDSAAATAKRYVRTAGMRRLDEDPFYLQYAIALR